MELVIKQLDKLSHHPTLLECQPFYSSLFSLIITHRGGPSPLLSCYCRPFGHFYQLTSLWFFFLSWFQETPACHIMFPRYKTLLTILACTMSTLSLLNELSFSLFVLPSADLFLYSILISWNTHKHILDTLELITKK